MNDQLPDHDPDHEGLGTYDGHDRIGDDFQPTPEQIAVKRAAHAVLLAIVENDQARIHHLFCADDTTLGFLIEVIRELGGYYVDSFGRGHEEMRLDLIADLHRLAAG